MAALWFGMGWPAVNHRMKDKLEVSSLSSVAISLEGRKRMSITLCPAAVVAAPVEYVWELLSEPTLRDEWWDARTARRAGGESLARAGDLFKNLSVSQAMGCDAQDREGGS